MLPVERPNDAADQKKETPVGNRFTDISTQHQIVTIRCWLGFNLRL